MATGTQKTVTLRRGTKGFGFTLAEQYPCYLSSVHNGGVADGAGLRAGDQLVAVGATDVCRLPHSEIVNLLADSGNKLTLTVNSRKPLRSQNNLHNGNTVSVPKRQPEHQQDGHWTDQSSMDSDSPIWRQQKMGAECRLHAGSLRRHQESAPAPYSNAINGALSLKTAVNGAYGNLENAAQRKKSRKSRPSKSSTTNSLWQINSEAPKNSPNFYENSLPSSLRGKRGRSVSKRGNNLHRRGVQYSSQREIPMNRSMSEPDFLAESPSGGAPSGGDRKQWKNRPDTNVITSSMIAHADSDSDLSSDDSENEQDRSVTTSESENTSNDSPNILKRADQEENLIFQSVVVYIGAVPVQNLTISRRHVIRGALQSLRAQRAKARTVLLQVLADQVVVTNSRGCITHRVLVSRIVFASACAENKQYFGLCTVHPHENSSLNTDNTGTTNSSDCLSPNSTKSSTENEFAYAVCHMFAADPQLHLHSFHYNYAKKFGIACSRDPETGFCLEFPYISNPVLHALAYARRAVETAQIQNRLQDAPPQISAPNSNCVAEAAQQPQKNKRNNFKTPPCYMSSNSDSGIGGRECELPNNRGTSPAHSSSSSTTVINGVLATKNGAAKKKSGPPGGLKVTFEEPLPKGNSEENGAQLVVKAEVHKNFQEEERRVFDGKKLKRSEKSENAVFARSMVPNGTAQSASFRHNTQQQAEMGTYPRTVKRQELSTPKPRTCASETLPKTKSQQDLLEAGTRPELGAAKISRGILAEKNFSAENLLADKERVGELGVKKPAINVGTMASGAEPAESKNDNNCGKEKATKTPSVPEFDQMLADKRQRQPFEDFLKHQFCGENLTFWLGVESYKNANMKERAQLGKRLFENHFSDGCLEPVNVDSTAMHLIQKAADTSDFPQNLFDGPQYQIFHLMKYDCWPRFLKSEFAKNRRESQIPPPLEGRRPNGQPVDRSGSSGSLTDVTGAVASKGTVAQENQQEKSKRKSLIPWKGKFIASRKKKEGRGETQDNTASAAGQQETQSQKVAGSSGRLTAPGSRNEILEKPAPSRAEPGPGRISMGGNMKKSGWKASKQLSVPTEFYNAPPATADCLSSSAGLPRRQDMLEEQPENEPEATEWMETEASTSGVGNYPPQKPEAKCCVLILPGGQRCTAEIPEGVTVRQWLNSLGKQRGFNAGGTELFDQNSGDRIDFTGSAEKTLADRIIRLETSVLFKLELPLHASSNQENSTEETGKHRKLIAIRARSEHPAGLVLRPVLGRYGLELDKLVICLSGTTEVLPNSAPIRKADNRKLLVLSHQEFQDWVHSDHAPSSSVVTSPLLPGGGSQSSTGSSSASSPTDYFGESGPTFQEIPSSAGCSVTVGVAELPPKRRKAKAALPGEKDFLEGQFGAGAKGEERGEAGPISGMLKFVRNKTSSQTTMQQPSESQSQPSSARTQVPAGVSPNLTRKSLAPAPTSSEAPSGAELKRQTVASAKEVQAQIMQDKALGELLKRAQANRLDDQRGTSPMTYELPEFLRTEDLCQKNGTGITERSMEDEEKDLLFMEGENDVDFSEDCVIPTSAEAEALFAGIPGQTAPEFSGRENQEFTERKALRDYGFMDSTTVAIAEEESSNVSVVTVSDEATETTPLTIVEEETSPKRKVTPHSHGRASSLRCRPPPPPYPGTKIVSPEEGRTGSVALSPVLPPGATARTRAPICVPPSSFNAPVSKDLNTDVWRVDYV